MCTRRWFRMALVPSLCVSVAAAAQTGGTMPNHAGMQMEPLPGVTALLTSVLGTRSASGTATVEGRTVRVTWTGDPPGSTRAWYVHRGTCTRDEGMVGAANGYRPIVVDASGSGTATATLDVPLAAGGTYYVAVHNSATDAKGGVIACGPLTAGTAASAAAMDHSTMEMPAALRSGTAMPGMSGMMGADSASASLMAIHMRMMADPVIRERVRTDPVLMRMMAQMPAGMTMPMEAPGAAPAADPHAGHTAPANRVTKARPAPPARRPSGGASTPTRPATRPATRAPAVPAPADPHAGHTMPAPRKP